jgi:hypothetical protein
MNAPIPAKFPASESHTPGLDSGSWVKGNRIDSLQEESQGLGLQWAYDAKVQDGV